MHTLDIYAGITNHVFMEYLMAWINVHATISKKKKKSACETTYVIAVPVFFEILICSLNVSECQFIQ